ncbi:hypothetical protein [Parasitella parasitica]|uniref:Uncharacterized protein n=1 Tax=Parasitella parasitica TaxID=35722 RepID=A0A0B7NAB1_9FUNG|nr:hypothetical protein [Parasitella parasitica]
MRNQQAFNLSMEPSERQYFQWRRNIFRKNRACFATLIDCLDQFEWDMQAHHLPIIVHWEKIFPSRLFTAMARSHADIVIARGNFTWSGFREEPIKKCGKSSSDMLEHAREKSEKLSRAYPAFKTVELLVAYVESIFDSSLKTKWKKIKVFAS